MCDFKKLNDTKCLRNVLSGYGTIESEDGTKVAYLCRQHKDMYTGHLLDMSRVIWTDKINDNKENNMKDHPTDQLILDDLSYDTMYDTYTSLPNALAHLEGQPYNTIALKHGGWVLIEKCDHDDCNILHMEQFNEMNMEVCCGEEGCQHYSAILCEHHIPNNKENTVMDTTNIIKFTENGKGVALCVKCTKEEGFNIYHYIGDLRTCAGAPTPAAHTSNESWDRANFPTRKEAVAHQIAMKKGNVKFNEKTNRWDWFAHR